MKRKETKRNDFPALKDETKRFPGLGVTIYLKYETKHDFPVLKDETISRSSHTKSDLAFSLVQLGDPGFNM